MNNQPFYNTTRLENDNCFLSQRNQQDVRRGDYLLKNFADPNNNCEHNESFEMMTNQPGIHFKTSVVPGIYGCGLDGYKELRIDSQNITPRTKIMLNKRPYVTVPYLGRGEYNADLHSKLRIGDFVNRNEAEQIEHDGLKIENYPFIPLVKDTVSNPGNYIVESEGWVRGGIPSRDFFKDYTYKNLNNVQKQ